MLWVLRSESGHLQAVCEWWQVDEQGYWTPQGRYVFLHQLEVAPKMNLHSIRRRMVHDIGLSVPGALGVFWRREHDEFPRPHAFRREQLQLRKEVSV